MRALLVLLAVLLILPGPRAAMLQGLHDAVSGIGDMTRNGIRASVGFR
jgi:hypothetical protein